MPVEGDVLAYARSHGHRRFIVVLNLKPEPGRVRLLEPVSGRIVLSSHGRRTGSSVRETLELAPNEGVIIEAGHPSRGPPGRRA